MFFSSACWVGLIQSLGSPPSGTWASQLCVGGGGSPWTLHLFFSEDLSAARLSFLGKPAAGVALSGPVVLSLPVQRTQLHTGPCGRVLSLLCCGEAVFRLHTWVPRQGGLCGVGAR